MNPIELARDKFNALFAAHDAKDELAALQQQKAELKAQKKKATKNVKLQ